MFEDFYMPEFDAEYMNSPAFRRAIAAAAEEPIVPPPPPAPPPPPVYRPAVQSVEPLPVYRPAVQSVEPLPVYRPAVQSVEPLPVAGIGSAAVAAPAAAPSAIEAPAPLTYEEREARRIAANTSPEGSFLTAPTDNMGKATGYDIAGQKPNAFEYWGGPVRVRSGDKILFSGEGEEGAVAAARFAQNLSDTKGKNASWVIEQGERTINPDGSVGPTRWISGPSDTKEGMGTLGSLAAFVLPIAAAIVAGPMGIAAKIAMATAAGAVGGVLSGNDPLKSAIIAGVSAGIMDASKADQIISGALNKVLGPVATEATKEAVKKTGENLGKEILVKGVSKTVQAAANAAASALVSEATKAVLSGVTGSQPPPAQPPAEAPPAAIVTGARPEAVTGANAVAGIGSGAAADAVAGDARADTLEEEEAPIVVTGSKAPPLSALDVTNAIGGIIPSLIPDTIPGAGTYNPTENVIINTATPEPTAPDVTSGIGGAIPGLIPGAAVYDPVGDVIINTATPEPTSPEQPGSIPVTPLFVPSRITEGFTGAREGATEPEAPEERSLLDKALDVADVATAVLPIAGGIVGGGGGGGGTIAPDTSGITFRPSTLRPTLTGGGSGGSGGIGGISSYPYTPQTYGRAGGDQEVEYLFFTRDPAVEAPAVVPASAPGRKEGGEINDDMVKHLLEYRKGGGHHGPGQVKGIGSGQEDKIPAWLSDGEYVWSAQDVADLGDGSTDEGVRRLDKMRQMVRQQAGRKDVKKIAKPQKGIDRMLKAVGGLA